MKWISSKSKARGFLVPIFCFKNTLCLESPNYGPLKNKIFWVLPWQRLSIPCPASLFAPNLYKNSCQAAASATRHPSRLGTLISAQKWLPVQVSAKISNKKGRLHHRTESLYHYCTLMSNLGMLDPANGPGFGTYETSHIAFWHNIVICYYKARILKRRNEEWFQGFFPSGTSFHYVPEDPLY